ncbi:Adenosine 3'-phospho 5'-phosphosulfate transporter 2 [Gossypium arboreum]|uniref:Adenosine 3'-phospho 5'-phosphosulfate transporter 2 n=1 Tax=Gossypium arboreum TaxID=29729 RepID=A0A0B0NA18_GOSAR|nr:Adenosine 3'-phospho 5'-phosphosulfate transporter 2 [Gossypium arboreum]
MMLHTAEVVYITHQLSVPYLFELRLLLRSKYTSHAYTVHHPLKI